MVADKNRSLQELSAEVATNPNSTAFVELAGLYRERGDLDRALRLCLRGLERHPTHVEAHLELGRIYAAQGDHELAHDQWGVVRQLAPDHLAAWCSTVRLYLEEGRLDEAARALQRAQKLAPGEVLVQELWKRLRALQRDGRAAPGIDEEGRDVASDARGDGRGIQGGREALAELVTTHPGTVGILLVSSNGRMTASRKSGRPSDSDEDLARHLSGARAEAERVASHLGLGTWRRMIVEGENRRLSIAPMRNGVLIVTTSADMPAGRAAKVVQRALVATEVPDERDEG